jgi:hypothetical protein
MPQTGSVNLVFDKSNACHHPRVLSVIFAIAFLWRPGAVAYLAIVFDDNPAYIRPGGSPSAAAYLPVDASSVAFLPGVQGSENHGLATDLYRASFHSWCAYWLGNRDSSYVGRIRRACHYLASWPLYL